MAFSDDASESESAAKKFVPNNQKKSKRGNKRKVQIIKISWEPFINDVKQIWLKTDTALLC